MPRDELKATDATLEGLFEGEKLYLAPLLQRRFVWTRKELDELWEDIDQILAGVDKSRFLGALVLQDESTGLAFEPNTYWIIDGQQRLTTLYIMLIVVATLAEHGRSARLARDIVHGVLLNQSSHHLNEPKLRPTNSDLRQFGDALRQLKTFDLVAPPPEGHHLGRLRNMHEMIRDDLTARVRENGSGYLRKLTDLILGKLRFVQILTSSDENPHQVFDRLTSGGQRLEIIDLVRNVVFSKFRGNPKTQQNFYDGAWRRFEDELGNGINGYFFPFALISKPSTTQAQVFGDLKARWKHTAAENVLQELGQYVPDYNALSAATAAAGSKPYREAVERLTRMPVPSSTYPYLMRLLYGVRKDGLDEVNATQIMRLIESFFVRRAFAGYEPTGLHALFKDLWNDANTDVQALIKAIENRRTIQYPADDEFKEDVVGSELYGRRLAKYVLMEYEIGIAKGDPIQLTVDQSGRGPVPLSTVTSIDHVMPQELTPDWAKVVDEEVHETWLHTWANLVPLTIPFNSSKQGKSWEKVREEFKKESIYRSPRVIAEFSAWDQDILEKRANDLAEWALKRWPRIP